MKMEKLLTKDRFAAWLKAQSPNRRFKTECPNHCVVAQYIHDSGKSHPSVDEVTCSYRDKNDDLRACDTPKWLGQFIQAFDDAGIGSPKKCLELLETI